MERNQAFIWRKKSGFVCVFILTGCSINRSTEEKIFMEGEKEELEEEKMAEPEMESSSDFIDADTEDSTESIVIIMVGNAS